MTIVTRRTLTVSVPLTHRAHIAAQHFHQHHFPLEKAKQVYLNTLAVYATNSYLNYLGVETDVENSQSWSPILQTLANTADLIVKDWGKLECRPVLPESEVCSIPPDVWTERRGYVAVQLNRELTEATLLGFVPKVPTQTAFPLDRFRSLAVLLDSLSPVTTQQPCG